MCNDHWKSVGQYKTKFTYLNKPRDKKRERERDRIPSTVIETRMKLFRASAIVSHTFQNLC